MLKYIFVVGKSTQKIVFLLTPARIGDFKSVIRISPSYKNKTKIKQSACSYSEPFYYGKDSVCNRSFAVRHSTKGINYKIFTDKRIKEYDFLSVYGAK